MSRNLWLVLGGLVLLAGGWLGYRQFIANNRSIDALVPPGAVLMLASDHLQDTLSAQALRTEIALRQLPVFDEARQRLDQLLYATADTATVLSFISKKTVRYSLHSVSRNTLDFIFYVPLTDDDQPFIQRLTNPDPRRYRVLSHSFSGERILDLVSRANEPVGSFILTDDFLVGSVSGILVENVARQRHRPINLTQNNSVMRVEGSVDADHIAGLSIRPEVLQALFSDISSLVKLFLPEELNLQFRPGASRSHLIGYATDEIGARHDVADLFSGQTPQRIAHPNLIPQTTASLYHIGISDAPRFGRSMSRLLGSASSGFLRDRFGQIAPLTEPLYQSLDRDVLLCRMESPTGSSRQVLVLPARDGKQLVSAYQRIAFRAGTKAPASLQTFLGHKILLLDVRELPASLFSSLFTGFAQSWITQHGSALIVANSEETLQDYLQQIQRGATWSADERQVDLLRGTLRPANFTAFVRLNRTPTAVPPSWPLAWQNLLAQPDPTTGSPALANLENMAYQASYGNENIQSTVVLGRTTRRASQAVLNKLLLRKRTEFSAALVAAPIATGSLSDGPVPFYTQDEARQLVFTLPQGEKVGQATLDGPIRSNALAVDFLNNGRLQYLFMTDRTLYVADPGQSMRANNPSALQRIPLPDGLDPTYLTRPRGNQQRDIMALAVHPDGHVYGLDRQRRAFVRLMSAPHKGTLLVPVQVSATPGGMNILAMQPDGFMNYWRENGTQQPNFPVRIERVNEEDPDIRFSGPALVLPGQPTIQTITDEGQLLTLQTNGQITKRIQLYRPIRSGSFRIFADEDQTNWLLLRSTDTEVAVLDQRGQLRFEVRALPSGRNSVRYHRLGAGVDLISVKSGAFTTLYDLNGRIIGDRPIPGDFPLSLQFDERSNELYILSSVQKTVQLFSIRLR